MTLPSKIIETITATPNLTAGEIAQKIEMDQGRVKVALWKLTKQNRVSREKVKTEVKRKGPQAEYKYSCMIQPS
jgi:predicted transcriptional regulator